MHALWHWLLYVLTWSSADPGVIDAERARTAGSVNVAYAALATEPAPAPAPKPAAPAVCPCNGTGYTTRPDGSRWVCRCQNCPSGKCPQR
jgi:hypothetical protein